MRFERINVNPKQWKHEGDCVVRAIASSTQRTWIEVYKDLCQLGLKKCRMPNSQKVYEQYLTNLDYITLPQPRKFNNKKYRIDEWLELNPNFSGVLSIKNHLTCVDQGVLIDTWDCSRSYICKIYKKIYQK